MGTRTALLTWMVTLWPAFAGAQADLSPAEKAEKGDRTYGVFELHDPRCSQAAIAKYIGGGIIPLDLTLGQNAPGQPVTTAIAAEGVRSIVARALDQLEQNGDAVVAGRHICVGLANFGDSGPNAVSMTKGYIIGDPRLMDLVNGLPDRTMFSFDMFWTHEFGHQLQYWNGSPFDDDARDRRGELAADCAAAALVAMRWTEAFALEQVGQGVVAAAVSVGDLHHESKGHHGTPTERRIAAQAGFDLVLAARRSKAPLPTSKKLLDACNAMIMTRDKATGPNWAK